MAAKRDRSKSTYFVIGVPNMSTCAAHSAGSLMFKRNYPIKKAWTVCEHLSTAEKVMTYHQESNPILIIHGFVLCQECNNRNILTGQEGFDQMLRAAVPKDDIFFQKFIMKEDIPDNFCYWAKLHNGTHDDAEGHKHVCRHLNTSRKINAHYASRQPLFWYQDRLLCSSCLNELKNGNEEVIDSSVSKLHDNMFTEQIVGPLCTTNTEHFGLK